MSIIQEINEPSQEREEAGAAVPAEAVVLMVKEVNILLAATTDSLQAMFARIESSQTRDDVRTAFKQFNRVMKIFMGLASEVEYDLQVRQAICDMGVSQRFEEKLADTASLREAVTAYKTEVVRQLGLSLHKKRVQANMDEDLDEDLLT